MSKKAQITMFVILGLILLILVVMFFGFINQLKQKPASVKKIIDELETGRLKDHVTNCMAKVGAEGLEKLGANGGVIYDFEGGRIPVRNTALENGYLNYTYLGQTYLVAYGLRKNTACNQIDYSLSGYPYPGVSVDQLAALYNQNCLYNTPQSGYDGFFGQIVLNKLCYLARQSGCEPFANGPIMGLTLQKQLEDYVAKKLPLCIDFDEFIQRLDANVTVDLDPVIETNIHDAEILLVAKYPITISFDNKEPITQIISYQTTLNVRLARVYNFLHNALLQEAKNINFNIATDYTFGSVYWKQGIELTIIRAPCIDCQAPYKYDDIIEVTDRNSSVNGKPFTFRVAIENRRPVLEPIPDQEISSINDLEVPLRAQDPDDTAITYRFLSMGYGNENCGEGASRLGALGAWNYQDPPCLSNADSWCSNNPNPLPGSPSLLSIPITEFDYGTHQVGLLAIDEAGLFDYQLFKINVTYDVNPAAPDTSSCISSCTNGDYIYGAISPCPFPPPFDNSLDYPYPADVNGYCEKWCEIAANPCGDWCDFTNPDPYLLFWDSCRACVLPIVNSGQPNQYNCQQYNGDRYSCIANMPNCYLILEKSRYDDSFSESCYDIINFDLINTPALIITS